MQIAPCSSASQPSALADKFHPGGSGIKKWRPGDNSETPLPLTLQSLHLKSVVVNTFFILISHVPITKKQLRKGNIMI